MPRSRRNCAAPGPSYFFKGAISGNKLNMKRDNNNERLSRGYSKDPGLFTENDGVKQVLK